MCPLLPTKNTYSGGPALHIRGKRPFTRGRPAEVEEEVRVRVAVRVAVGDADRVVVGVALRVSVPVGVADRVGVGVALLVAVAVGVAVGSGTAAYEGGDDSEARTWKASD